MISPPGGRQKEEFGAGERDGAATPLSLLTAEVVEMTPPPGLQRRLHKDLLKPSSPRFQQTRWVDSAFV
jgi:hypothetical protein